jgi:hypothetical protein
MRILWIVCILLLISAVVWSFRKVEGFQAVLQGKTYDFPDTMIPADTYDGRRDYFHYQRSPLDKPGIVLVDPGIFAGPSAITKEMIDQATKTPGYEFDPSSAANGISKFFSTADAEEDMMNDICKNAEHPRNLKGSTAFMTKRARDQQGCGWWYVSDLYKPSTGAFGSAPTIDGSGRQTAPGRPSDSNIPTQFPGGEWIWDLDTAIKLEDIKRCRRIQNCDLIDGVQGCAFCPSKGYAVPVKDSGQLKYPNDDAANCGDLSSLVSQGRQCPPLVIQPRLTNYDYDYDQNGNVVVGPNSSALAQVGQTLEFICAASPLSKACRLAMCKELAGCTEGKGLHRIVQQNGTLTETDRLALQYLANRGSLSIPTTFTESGTMDKAAAMNLMERIRTTSTSNQSGIAKAAARWLIDETPFDVCLYGDTDTGPFPIECLQREFRKAGCQASGSRYPTTASAFTGMSFGTIKTQFRDLFAQMSDTDRMTNVRDQDRAVQACLGIGMVRDANETWARNPNLCRDPGIEYWIYSIPTVGNIVLLGRMVVPELLTTSSDTATSKTLQALLQSATGFRGFTARTYVDIGATPTTVSLTLPTGELNNNYSVWINGIERKQLSNIPLVLQQRNLIEVRFEIPTGSAFGDPSLSVSPESRLVLNQSAWKPFIALEPQLDINLFKDTNQYLDVKSAQVERVGTRDGLIIRQSPVDFVLRRGIAYQAMKTITCMFYWKSLAGQSTVFQMDQGRGGASDTVLAFQIVDKFPTFTLQSPRGLYKYRSTVALGTPNQWVHVAILLGTADTLQVWINGSQIVDPLRKEAFGGSGSVYTRLLFGSPGFDGAIGWFHIYDRRLTVAEIGRDRRYDDTLLSDKDTGIDVGSSEIVGPVGGPIRSPVGGPVGGPIRSPVGGPVGRS